MRVSVASLLIALCAAALPAQQRSSVPAQGLIVGQVIDATSGRPVTGAVVAISGNFPGPPDGSRTPGRPRVLTGGDGRFFFRDLPRGTFSITATKAGYVEGASGRRRPGGAAQPITLADGQRVGDVVVRMWKHAAITGTVVDEMGEPVVGAAVRPFRREFAGGRPRYVAGAGFVQPFATTDDRGVYRLGSLVPGDYMVATIGRPVATSLSMAQELQNGGFPTTADTGPVMLPGTAGSMQVGNAVYSFRTFPVPAPNQGRWFVYPATFYPSVTAFPQAVAISVGPGEERSAIDLQVHPLPTVRVAGSVIGPDGPATALALRLYPANAEEVGFDIDVPTAISDRNGSFEFPAVPAGQYVLRASVRPPRADPRRLPPALWLEVPVAAGRFDIEGLALALQEGFRVAGRVEFEGSLPRPAPARLQQVPLALEAASGAPNGVRQITARVEQDGRFTVPGAPGGQYVLRVLASPEGWMFKSATFRGRDVSDQPFDLDSDANDAVITFTDRWTGMHGVVQGARGADPDATVLIFPVDQQAWTNYSVSSRRVRSVRTSRGGDYNAHSIPAGDYYVVAIPDDRAADWQDPAFLQSLTSLASRVTIGDGEHKLVGLRTRELR